MSGEMKAEGLAALQSKLLKLAGAVGGRKILSQAGRVAMKPVLAAAREDAPKATGVLAKSIAIRSAKARGGSVVASTGLVIRKTRGLSKALAAGKTKRQANAMSAHWRWHFIERGTSKSPARPFLRPAFRRNQKVMLGILSAELRKHIRKITERSGRR